MHVNEGEKALKRYTLVHKYDSVSIIFGKPILGKQISCNERTVNTYKFNYRHNKLFIFTLEAFYFWDFSPDINQ